MIFNHVNVNKFDTLEQITREDGEDAANKISKAATTRGTKLHAYIENYLNNTNAIEEMSFFQKELFTSILPELHKINNIHVQEQKLYSDHLRLAGTVDCIGEY
jgi:genome maintenance exonuclease 1